MTESFFKAEVLAVTSTERIIDEYRLPRQEVRVLLETGGTPFETEIIHEGDEISGDYRAVSKGEHVVVLRSDDEGQISYSIFDHDRTGWLTLLSIAFVILVVIVGRRKGFFALLGATLGLGILLWFIVPQILSGQSPLLVALGGSAVIACSTMLLGHGFHRRTWVALAGTLIALVCVAGIAWAAVWLTQMTGLGTPDAFLFQFGPIGAINMRGLLLAGIIIGALGALDDVTTAQSAVVAELKEANPSLGFRELFRRGSSVGHEHIAS